MNHVMTGKGKVIVVLLFCLATVAALVVPVSGWPR